MSLARHHFEQALLHPLILSAHNKHKQIEPQVVHGLQSLPTSDEFIFRYLYVICESLLFSFGFDNCVELNMPNAPD